MPLSHQNSPDGARIVREGNRDFLSLTKRLRLLEDRIQAVENFIAGRQLAYLEGLATFVGYTSPPAPPWRAG